MKWMKWIRWAVIAGVVSLGQAALAEPGCKDWNTRPLAFFRDADGELVRECLAAGADPNARNERGWTPLQYAAWKGNAAAINALLAGGADPNARDKDGDTPLHYAAWNGHAAAVDTLLDGGADPGVQGKYGATPFDLIFNNSPLVGTPAYRRLRKAR